MPRRGKGLFIVKTLRKMTALDKTKPRRTGFSYQNPLGEESIARGNKIATFSLLLNYFRNVTPCTIRLAAAIGSCPIKVISLSPMTSL